MATKRVTIRKTKAFRWDGSQAKADDGSILADVELTGVIEPSRKYFIINYPLWGNIVNPPYAFLLVDTVPVDAPPEPPAGAETITWQPGHLQMLDADTGETWTLIDAPATFQKEG